MSREMPSIIDRSKEKTPEEKWVESIKELDGKGEDIDVSPENLKTETPVLIAGGFSTTPKVYEAMMVDLLKDGRRILAPNKPHGVETTEPVEGLPMAELRKAAGVLELLNRKEISKADVVAHSEAGIYAILAAREHPEKFRNIILVEPAGLVGPDDFFKLIGRFVKDIGKTQLDLLMNPKKQTVATELPPQDPLKVIFGNVDRSYEEGQAIANTDTTGMLADLDAKGVHVYIVHSVDEVVFPMQEVQSMVKKGMVRGFYSVTPDVGPGHNDVILSQRFAESPRRILNNIENAKPEEIQKTEDKTEEKMAA